MEAFDIYRTFFDGFRKNLIFFRVYNRSAKITKLQTAFHHLCKMLRHPQVLQEITRHKFTVWDKKRFIDGQTLVKMIGTRSFDGGFQINIKRLPRGKIL